MTDDTAHVAQQIADDALVVAEHLGFICPPLVIVAAGVKLLVDGGFALFLREAATAVAAQRAAQTAGVAAAEAQAVTSALEHDRLKRICPPCAEALIAHIRETTP